MSNSNYLYCGVKIAVGTATSVVAGFLSVVCGVLMRNVYDGIFSCHAKAILIEREAPLVLFMAVSAPLTYVGAAYAMDGFMEFVNLIGESDSVSD